MVETAIFLLFPATGCADGNYIPLTKTDITDLHDKYLLKELVLRKKLPDAKLGQENSYAVNYKCSSNICAIFRLSPEQIERPSPSPENGMYLLRLACRQLTDYSRLHGAS